MLRPSRELVRPSRWRKLGRALAWTAVVVSFPLWLAAFAVVPFLPLEAAAKVGAVALCIALSEALFWSGGLVLGASMLARFRAPKVTTCKSFQGLRVVIVGATGGLGSAIARAVQREGGQPVLVGRDSARLAALAEELQASTLQLDLNDTAAIDACAGSLAALGPISHLVCAAGADVRKPFLSHSAEELERLLQLNWRAPLLLTRAFLPYLQPSATIALIGGAGDGHLPSPYRVPDAASRSGLASFCHGINQELALEGYDVRVCYVSPAPTDTETERPFAALWASLGSPLVPPTRVADVVLRALLARQGRAIMGVGTRALCALNALCPALGGWLVRRSLGAKLNAHFGEHSGEHGGEHG
ncbi:MAG: hypothetical protein RL033_270 [Pseudomonadota bacterium]